MDWLGPIVWEYYAATEGSGTLVSPQQWLRKPGTVGKVDPPDHVRILDANGAEAARGEVGTVYLKAPAPAATGRFEYYKAPEKTAGAYSDAGDYFTLGDYGYVDADGFLFLTDRSAHLIISGGVNIYPAEAEQVLLRYPGVADVAVLAAPNREMGEEVKALIVPADPANPPSTEDLNRFCRESLAGYKCPRSYDFVDDIGRTAMGKVNKKALRQRFWPSDRTIGG
jgi:acyl-CoA synthetase (AMP-forming)/AMP-acid ligase II